MRLLVKLTLLCDLPKCTTRCCTTKQHAEGELVQDKFRSTSLTERENRSAWV